MSFLLLTETRPIFRKRRDLGEVQFEVTMDSSTDDEGDFEEFQMRYHHSRVRRSGKQCHPQCESESDKSGSLQAISFSVIHSLLGF